MNKKNFKKPSIPMNLTQVADPIDLLEEGQREETDIVNKRFEGIFLTKFDGKEIRFRQSVFINCKLMGCYFDRTWFTDVKFINCNFYNTSFSDAVFKQCAFENCKGEKADFYGCTMQHVSFTDGYFTGAGFDASRMSYIMGNHTDFTEAGFSQCKFANTDWMNVCFQKAEFFKTSLKDMNFSSCNIDGIIISDNMSELKGMKVNLFQAVDLAKRLGIEIEEENGAE